jgi:hypothetical protein
MLTRGHCSLLPAHPTSASAAREQVTRSLEEWGCQALTDSAQLIISELVGNSVKAVAGYVSDDVGARCGMVAGCVEVIRVGCYQSHTTVVLEVWDSSRKPPKLINAGEDDVGGRGLQLIAALASSWGYRWLKPGGKVTWAALDVTP